MKLALAILLSSSLAWGAQLNTVNGVTTTVLSGTSVRVDWTDTTQNGVGWRVERCDASCTSTSATWALKALVQYGSGKTFTDTGLTPGTPYTWRVLQDPFLSVAATPTTTTTVTTTTGTGSTTTIPDTTPPSTPQNLSGTVVNCTTVGLSWSQSTDNPGGTGVSQYWVYRYSSANNVWAFLKLTIEPTTSTTDTRTPGSINYYRVDAVDDNGNHSAPSGYVSVVLPNC